MLSATQVTAIGRINGGRPQLDIMVRRTKEEARSTRVLILNTAEDVFGRRGVAGTSLEQIAKAAGLTRGAIYWHFNDKASIFNALMERTTMPLEAAGGCQIGGADKSLAEMRKSFKGVLKRIVADPQMRRVFEIAIHKVEYVDEMRVVRERRLNVRDKCVNDFERMLAAASECGDLPFHISWRAAAIGLHALLDGLIQLWMLDPTAFDLVKVGPQAVDAYLAGLAA